MKRRNLVLGLLVAGFSFTSIFAATAAQSTAITMEEAKAIAQNKVPGGIITSIELDHKKSSDIYKVKIYLNDYKYNLKLDAVTGEGISIHKEYEDHNKSSALQNAVETSNIGVAGNLLTQAEAETITLNQVPDAVIEKIELEYEDGKVIYEVKLRKDNAKYEIEMDAVTGVIYKNEID